MKPTPTYQKLRGGYYTPAPIADFLAKWAIRAPSATVLDPSCGDGVLLEAAMSALLKAGASRTKALERIHAVEFDPQEAEKALLRLRALGTRRGKPHIESGDFFRYCMARVSRGDRFDAVIGNPPFIRYQNFPEEHRQIAFYLMQRAGLHPNRLTNAWVPFLVTSTMLLSDTGRLAMVIPAELLQVNYAAELRYFLSTYYERITLVTFKKLLFDGAQQEVVLFLGERGASAHPGIRTVELHGLDDLDEYLPFDTPCDTLKEMDHSTEKWTMYFLDELELRLLRALRDDPRLVPAGHVMDVDVGVVTGLNEFFILNEPDIESLSLEPYTSRIVCRSGQLGGLIYSENDWRAHAARHLPAYLLNAPDVPFANLPGALQEYIADGEERGLNRGYKCRIRKRWYIPPMAWVPQAFMLRQVHGYPKVVINAAGATSTDTIHRVRLRNGASAQTVAAAFVNSLTFAFSEVIGRSYGGGVLELEPNEAEKLPLPLAGAEKLDVARIDTLLRKGDIESALDITDSVLLRDGLGLSEGDTAMLRGIWHKLRDRRINRKPDTASRRRAKASA